MAAILKAPNRPVKVDANVTKYHAPATAPPTGASPTGHEESAKPRFLQARTQTASIPQNIPGGGSGEFALVGFRADAANNTDVYVLTDENQGTDGLRLAAGDTTPLYLFHCSLASIRIYSTATGQIVYFWCAGKYLP